MFCHVRDTSAGEIAGAAETVEEMANAAETQVGADEATGERGDADDANTFHVVVDEGEQEEDVEEGGGGESDGTESSLHPEEQDQDDGDPEEGPGCPEWVAKKKAPPRAHRVPHGPCPLAVRPALPGCNCRRSVWLLWCTDRRSTLSQTVSTQCDSAGRSTMHFLINVLAGVAALFRGQ